MTKRGRLTAIAVCLLSTSAWADVDPQIGNWRLDLAKSRFVTATAPKSSMATVKASGKDGISVSTKVVSAQGEKFSIQYSAQYDGKPYPRTETGAGSVPGQTLTLKRIDAQTIERVVYVAGKPAGTEVWVISKDGQTRTVTQSGMDPKGKPIDNVLVFERQAEANATEVFTR
jgi:hypothetical protein